MTPTIRPATKDLLERFYGYEPKVAVEAIALMSGDDVIGIAGVYKHGDGFMMFSDTTERLRKCRKFVATTAWRLVLEIAERGKPIYAIRSNRLECSDRFLRYLGFKAIDERICQWQG